MFSVFFRDGAGARLRRRAATRTSPAFAAFFHAMLEPGRLPAAERVRVVVRQRRPRRRRGRAGSSARLPGRRRRAAARRRLRQSAHEPDAQPTRTVVHLLRHGEVHNPEGVLYGRLPGYHLSELGRQMAELVGRAPRRPRHHRTSSRPRSSGPRRPPPRSPAAHGLEVTTDDRRHRGRATTSRASTFGVGAGGLRAPAALAEAGQPVPPVVGRALRARSPSGCSRRSTTPATRPGATRRSSSRHQLPIWTARSRLEGRRLWHDPRQRQCSLASLTTLTYVGGELGLDRPTASRPAALLPRPTGGGRMTACRARCGRRGAGRRSRSARVRRGPQLRRGAGQGRATRRATSPVTAPSRRSPPATRQEPVTLDGHHARRVSAGRSPTTRGKVVVINVWGSWCAPCVAEAPDLQKAWDGLSAAGKPVQFMGIDFREDPARGRGLPTKANNITYPSPDRRVGRAHPGPAGQGAHRARRPWCSTRPGRHRGPGQRPGLAAHAARPRRRRAGRGVSAAAAPCLLAAWTR